MVNNIEIITEFGIKPDREQVFALIDLYPGNPVYDEVIKVYEQLETKVIQSIKPKLYLKYGQAAQELLPFIEVIEKAKVKSPVIYVLLTLGDEIEHLASEYFKKGEYLLGLLIDAMADSYLFQMDHFVTQKVTCHCLEGNYGIERRLEAPSDVPMSVQKVILEEIKKEIPIPIEVTSGYMFTSIKTMSYILVLNQEGSFHYHGHDCSTCSNKACKLRKV